MYKVLEHTEEPNDSRKGGLVRLIFNTPVLNGNISNTSELLHFPHVYRKHSFFVDMFYVMSLQKPRDTDSDLSFTTDLPCDPG